MGSKLLNKKKGLYDSVLTKAPKFRRKLIEKYSTRRYNVNTKLIRAAPSNNDEKRSRLCNSKIDQKALRKSLTACTNISSSPALPPSENTFLISNNTVVDEKTDQPLELVSSSCDLESNQTNQSDLLRTEKLPVRDESKLSSDGARDLLSSCDSSQIENILIPFTNCPESNESNLQKKDSSIVDIKKQESTNDVPSQSLSDMTCIDDTNDSKINSKLSTNNIENSTSNFECIEANTLEKIACANNDQEPESRSDKLLSPTSDFTSTSNADCSQNNVESSKIAPFDKHKSNEDNTMKKVSLLLNNDKVVVKPKLGRKMFPTSSEKSTSCVNLTNSHSQKMSTEKVKLVSSKFYSYLFEKDNEQKAIVKSVKRRKRSSLSKKKKKNVNSQQEKNNIVCRDPYLQDLENLIWEKANPKENTALVVHLGVGRPLYPVIHQNIISLCQQKDAEITDMWAEFSLSTLVENQTDCSVKPILMPVVDASLLSAIMQFEEEWKIDPKEMEVTKVVNFQPLLPVDKDPKLDQRLNSSKNKRKRRGTSWTRPKKYACTKQNQNLDPTCSKKPVASGEAVCPKETSIDDTKRAESLFKPCWVVLKRLEVSSLLGKFSYLPDQSVQDVPKKYGLRNKNQSTLTLPNKKMNQSNPTQPDQVLKKVVPKSTLTRTSLPNKKIAPLDQKSLKSSPNKLISRLQTKARRNTVIPTLKTETVSPKKLVSPPSIKSRKKPTSIDEKIPSPEKTINSRKKPTPVHKILSLEKTINSRKKPTPVDKKISSPEKTVHSIINVKTKAVLPKKILSLRKLFGASSVNAVIEPAHKGQIIIKQEETSFSPKVAVLQQVSPNVEKLIQKTSLSKSKSPNIGNQSLCVPPVPPKEIATLPPPQLGVQTLDTAFDDGYDEEWVSTEHYFGQKHCSRTYGPMIDYLTRNKSLIYFYKVRRILKFQRKNNRHFQSCFYLRPSKSLSEEDDFVDVLTDVSNDDVGDSSEITVDEPSVFKEGVEKKMRMLKSVSSNPLEVMRFPRKMNIFGLAVLRDMDNQNQYLLRFVNSELFQNLSNTKWIILQLHQDVIEIVFNQSFELAARLLFEVMYRADLTKKIVCHTVNKAKNDGSLELGVYGIPGLCDAVILGPCRAPERYNSLQAILQRPSGDIETLEVPINAARSGNPTNETLSIKAVWWRPVNMPLEVTSINAAYLNFLFKWQAATFQINQAEKLVLSTISKKHNAESVTRYVGTDGDVNYVLAHCSNIESASSRLLQLLQCKNNDDSVKKTKKKKKRPRAAIDKASYSFVESSNVQPRLESSNVQPQSQGLLSKLDRQELRNRENARRQELRMNRAFLNSVVAGVKVIPSSDVALNSVLNEATNAITMLKRKYLKILREKETLIKRRKQLLYRFVLLTRDGDENIARTRKAILSQLSLPRYGEMVEKEQLSYSSSASAKTDMLHLGQSIVAETLSEEISIPVRDRNCSTDIDNIVILPTRRAKRRRKRTKKKAATDTSAEVPNSMQLSDAGSSPLSKPVHVTVQSGDRIIGLGPYTEHNYCNFVDTSFSDPVEDPLGDLTSKGSFKNYSYTETGYANASQSSVRGKQSNDAINICVTEGGKPIFKLAINRTKEFNSEEKNRGNSRPDMKTLIQRILNEMKVKLNEKDTGGESKMSKNHVELLQNILSDSKNEHFFSEISQKEFITKKDYNDFVPFDVNNDDYQAESTVRLKDLIDDSIDDMYYDETGSHLPQNNTENETYSGKLVSLNSLIDESVASNSNDTEGHNFCVSSNNNVENNIISKTRPGKLLVEEQYVENNLLSNPVLTVPKPTIKIAPSQVVGLPRVHPKIFHTIPILRRVGADGQEPARKHVPIILGKRPSILASLKKPYKILVPRKNLAQLSKFPTEGYRIRCPSFVPVTVMNKNATNSSTDVPSTSTSNESSIAPVPEIETIDLLTASPPHEMETNYDSLAVDEESSNTIETALVEEGSENSLIEEIPISEDVNDSNVIEVLNSSTESETPFRLSVKSFASLNVFKNDVCTNVDKLLKF